MLRLSIITVTYNNYRALVKTTESIEVFLNLNSKYRNFIEHVIVDGGSKDNTLIFLKTMKTDAMREFISESDHGIYDAMNKGIRLARGRFIVFLNAGDEISKSFQMEQLFSKFARVENDGTVAGIAYSAIMRFKSKDLVVSARQVDGSTPRMPTIHQSIFYKKEVLDQYPYDINYRICGDYEGCLRIVRSGYRFEYSSDVFAIFYAGGTSSNNLIKLFKESMLATKKHINPSFINSCWIKLRLVINLVVMKAFLVIFKTLS